MSIRCVIPAVQDPVPLDPTAAKLRDATLALIELGNLAREDDCPLIAARADAALRNLLGVREAVA